MILAGPISISATSIGAMAIGTVPIGTIRGGACGADLSSTIQQQGSTP